MREAPGMAERVNDPAVTHAPERVPWRHRYGGAGVRRALHGGVAILDFEMHRDRGSLDHAGWKHGIRGVRAAMFREIVIEEKAHAIETEFGMHQALAVFRGHAMRLGGAEGLLVERDRRIAVVDDEMRRDGLHGVGHVQTPGFFESLQNDERTVPIPTEFRKICPVAPGVIWSHNHGPWLPQKPRSRAQTLRSRYVWVPALALVHAHIFWFAWRLRQNSVSRTIDRKVAPKPGVS